MNKNKPKRSIIKGLNVLIEEHEAEALDYTLTAEDLKLTLEEYKKTGKITQYIKDYFPKLCGVKK